MFRSIPSIPFKQIHQRIISVNKCVKPLVRIHLHRIKMYCRIKKYCQDPNVIAFALF